MRKSYLKILRNRKRRIQRRLDPKRGWSDQAEPIIKASNIHYIEWLAYLIGIESVETNRNLVIFTSYSLLVQHPSVVIC